MHIFYIYIYTFKNFQTGKTQLYNILVKIIQIYNISSDKSDSDNSDTDELNSTMGNLSMDPMEGTSEQFNNDSRRKVRNCTSCDLNFSLKKSEENRAVSCENINCLVTLCHNCQPMNYRACNPFYCVDH